MFLMKRKNLKMESVPYEERTPSNGIPRFPPGHVPFVRPPGPNKRVNKPKEEKMFLWFVGSLTQCERPILSCRSVINDTEIRKKEHYHDGDSKSIDQNLACGLNFYFILYEVYGNEIIVLVSVNDNSILMVSILIPKIYLIFDYIYLLNLSIHKI